MIILTTKRYNEIMARIEALEDAVTTPKKELNGHRGGALYMYEAIDKIMSDGKPRTSKQLSKEINAANIIRRKAKPRTVNVRLAESCRKGKLVRVSNGIYQATA